MKITKSRLKEIIKQSIQEEKEYDKYFKGMLAKYGVQSPADLSDEEKSKFFTDIDKGWDGKNESVNETSRRATDFFGDSKHGKAIHQLLKGKWDSKKVQSYLDKIDENTPSDAQYVRIMDSMARGLGLNSNKYKTVGEMEPEMMKSMERLYNDFLTESLDEALSPNMKKDGGTYYVDTDFVQYSNNFGKLDHIGYGDFTVRTNKGDVNFWRVDKKIPGFSGRTHKVSGDQKAIEYVLKGMKKKYKLTEFGRISSDWVAVQDGKIITTFPGYKEASQWFANNKTKHKGVSIKSKKDHMGEDISETKGDHVVLINNKTKETLVQPFLYYNTRKNDEFKHWQKLGMYKNFRDAVKVADKFDKRKVESILENRYDAQMMTDYLNGKMSAKELQTKAREVSGTSIATRSELESFLKNKFLMSVMADTYNVPVSKMTKKIKELLPFVEVVVNESTQSKKTDSEQTSKLIKYFEDKWTELDPWYDGGGQLTLSLDEDVNYFINIGDNGNDTYDIDFWGNDKLTKMGRGIDYKRTISMVEKFLKSSKGQKYMSENKSTFNESVNVNESVEPSSTLNAFFRVANSQQSQKVGGVLVDMQTAVLVSQIWDVANTNVKKKLNNLNAKQLGSFAWKVAKGK